MIQRFCKFIFQSGLILFMLEPLFLPPSVLCTVVFVKLKHFVNQTVNVGYLCRLSVVYCMFTEKYLMNVFIFLLFIFCLFCASHSAARLRLCSPALCDQRALICAASLSIIYSGFDSFGWFLRHPGVSHQFRRREFTTHLKLSIRRGALFPLLEFQLYCHWWALNRELCTFRRGVC